MARKKSSWWNLNFTAFAVLVGSLTLRRRRRGLHFQNQVGVILLKGP